MLHVAKPRSDLGDWEVYADDGTMVARFLHEVDARWYAQKSPHVGRTLKEDDLTDAISEFILNEFTQIDTTEDDGQVVLVHAINGQNFRIRVEEF